MTLTEFVQHLYKRPLLKHQKEMLEYVESGKPLIIGCDPGSPRGDKSCTIYGHTCDGRIIIDDMVKQ